MPVLKCPNGKYRVGTSKCMYDKKSSAEKAYRAYLAIKYSPKKGKKNGSKT